MTILVCACSKSSDRHDDPAASSAQPVPPPTPQAATVKPDAAKPAVAKRPLSELLSAKVPVPPKPLSKIRLGSTLAEAKQAAPEVFIAGWDSSFRTWLKSDEFDGVAFGVNVHDTSVYAVELELPKDKAKDLATAAWGAPREGTNGGHVQRVWFNAAAGIRAILDGDTISFTTYLPAAQLIGDGKERWGFESTPVIGMTVKDLEAAYPGRITDGRWIELPPTEMEWGLDRIVLHFAADRVSDWWFSIPYESAAGKAAIRSLLEKKWGKPKPEKRMKYDVLIFHEAPLVEVEDANGKWDIRVGVVRGGSR
jgi:hypothetical protein